MGASREEGDTLLPDRPGFDPGSSAGLFVGVSRFEDARFQAVPFAVDDAVDLAHLFALELELLQPAQAVLALSGEPRKEESQRRLARLLEQGARRETARHPDIYRLLGEQARAAGAEGVFLLSLATHGLSEQGNDFLIASDSLREHPIHTSVSVSLLFDKVSQAGAPRRMVLLDACRERLSQGERGEVGEGMSRSFADAIAKASGQVVLSGATYGGFAYDDLRRGNGVFTGGVLDGLRGSAPSDGQGLITVGALAEYLQQHVVEWVSRHRPDHATQSFGIAQQIEGPAESLPLAVNPHRVRERETYRQRRVAALARLGANLGGRLDGTIYNKVNSLIPKEGPLTPELEALVKEVEALDESPRAQQSLLFLVGELSGAGLEEAGRDEAEPTVPQSLVRGESPRGPAGPGVLSTRLGRSLAFLVSVLVCLGSILLWRYFADQPQKVKEPSNAPTKGTHPPEASKQATSSPSGRSTSPEAASSASPPRNPKPGTLWTSKSGLRLRFVPGGTYDLGSPKEEDGRSDVEVPRKATLSKGFWLAETEITQAFWGQLVDENPSHFKACGGDCPVENVNWYEAIAFANRLSIKEGLVPCYSFDQPEGELGKKGYSFSSLRFVGLDCPGYRLPTEAEWEIAARAGISTALYTGKLTILGRRHGPELNAIAWYGGNSGVSYPGAHNCSGWPERQNPKANTCGTHPVGLKQANSWELADMLGNVSEWTWDPWDPSPSLTAEDPVGSRDGPAEGAGRVIRGGSWSGDARGVRAACRGRWVPSLRGNALGFRLARGQVLR